MANLQDEMQVISAGRVQVGSANKRILLRTDGSQVDVQSDTHHLYLHSTGPGERNHVFINPHSNNGNVGIGTQSPRAKLDVNGSVWVSGTVSSGGNLVTQGHFHVLGDYVNIQGRADVKGNARFQSDVRVEGQLLQSSDARLKADVTPIADAMEKVSHLRGVQFTRIDSDTPSQRHAGVIAQDVQTVCPELVVSAGSDGYLAVNYPGLTGVLIEALKELQEQTQALTARIRDLESSARSPA
jgi:hypothetical protein